MQKIFVISELIFNPVMKYYKFDINRYLNLFAKILTKLYSHIKCEASKSQVKFCYANKLSCGSIGKFLDIFSDLTLRSSVILQE